MKTIALAATLFTALSACSPTSLAPKGWQPIPGTTNAWSTAVGSNQQQYRYEAYAFDGTLQDLASQVAVDALIRQHGVKLQSSPFGPCPGAAGVATVRLPDAKVLQVGFAVHNGQAIRVRYVRPPGVPVDPDVVSAMQAALCSL
jgi:hypothetical protein